jgi:hypothetical protein
MCSPKLTARGPLLKFLPCPHCSAQASAVQHNAYLVASNWLTATDKQYTMRKGRNMEFIKIYYWRKHTREQASRQLQDILQQDILFI